MTDYYTYRTVENIGKILFGMDENGVHTVSFDTLPAHHIWTDNSVNGKGYQLEGYAHQICNFIKDPNEWDLLDVPLSFRGTPDEYKVWHHLRTIPYGTFRSYGQVARSTGLHHRTVARYCGTNKLAIIVPCHRVVMGTGKIGGYHWGVEVKERLLRKEGLNIREGKVAYA